MVGKVPPLFIALATVLLCLLSIAAGTSQAGLYMTVEVLESYNDNVIGILSDNRTGSGGSVAAAATSQSVQDLLKGGIDGLRSQGTTSGMGGTGSGTGSGGGVIEEKGDFFTNLYANIGYDRDLGSRSWMMLEGSVDRTWYNTYSDFDFTIVTATAGIAGNITDRFLAKVTVHGSTKDYGNDLRDGTAYGGGILFRERISSRLWSRQSYNIEQNDADDPEYTHLRQTAGIAFGYDLTDDSTLSASYTYYFRDYNAVPPAVTVTSQVASVAWRTDIARSWSVMAGYDREWADSSVPDTAITSNTYTVGIRYSY